MTTTTIRVSVEIRDLLQSLAQESGGSMQEVLSVALEQYRRQLILDAANAGYAALRENKAQYAALEQERKEWDATIADGLEDM